MLKITDDFTLKRLLDGSNGIPQSEILLRHQQTGRTLAGAQLEIGLYFRSGGENRIVLILNQDCPYEESLSIYYLDQELAVLDQMEIGLVYSTGTFANFEITGVNSCAFSFFNGEERFHLKLFDEPKTLLPKPGSWPVVSRPLKNALQLKRSMDLTHVRGNTS